MREPPKNIRPDWWAVAIEETTLWNTPPRRWKTSIKGIYGVHFYDANEYTYCCEATPSFFLRPLYNMADLRDDTPDDLHDEINDFISEMGAEGHYMHVRDVQAIPSNFKRAYGQEAEEDEVREYWQGNCPF